MENLYLIQWLGDLWDMCAVFIVIFGFMFVINFVMNIFLDWFF